MKLRTVEKGMKIGRNCKLRPEDPRYSSHTQGTSGVGLREGESLTLGRLLTEGRFCSVRSQGLRYLRGDHCLEKP